MSGLGFIPRARIPKTATATAGTATVTTETPVNGQSVYIVSIYADYSAAQTAQFPKLTVTDGTTTLMQRSVQQSVQMEPCIPFQITPGKAAVVALPTGGASVIGSVNVVYYIA